MKPKHPEPNAVKFSQWMYGGLLTLYPKSHRQKYGAAMAQLFRDQCRDARRRAGWRGMASLWLRVLPDLAKMSVLEHVSAIKERKAPTTRSVVFLTFSVPVLLLLITASFFTLFRPESHSGKARIIVRRDTTDIPTSLISPGQAVAICVPYVIQQNKIELWPERNSNMAGIKVQ